MYECENFNNVTSEDELMHYGVLGMKWGVRRARKTLSSSDSTKEAKAKANASLDKHYEKASNKLNKTSAKADKRMAKARKHVLNTNTKWTEKGRARAKRKADKQRAKAFKQIKKTDKWVRAMEKSFKDTPIELTQAQRDAGRNYINTLNDMTITKTY